MKIVQRNINFTRNMEGVTIKTSRSSCRFYHPSDFDFVRATMADEQVMHFIRPATDDSEIVRERTDFWLKYASDYPGFGIFMIRLNETGEVAGYCVVRRVEYAPDRDIEIGYVLAREYWGRGLATEITQGMIKYAIANFNPPLILAYTDPANAASNRVLEKCGFAGNGMESVAQTESVRWELHV
ncbi:MAG: GNAT family N-acetyltransferase [Bacteroidota bacterium]